MWTNGYRWWSRWKIEKYWSTLHNCCSTWGTWKKPIRAPLGARAYPWILSKYFLCVRACVRPCVCPPTDKSRVCIFCVKTLSLCGILVVFCSYLEYNAITPFSSHVLYRFLHTSFFFLVRRSLVCRILGLYLVLTYVCRLYRILLHMFFSCTEVLSM